MSGTALYPTPPPPPLPVARQYLSAASKAQRGLNASQTTFYPTIPTGASELSLGHPVKALKHSTTVSQRAGSTHSSVPPMLRKVVCPSIAPTVESIPSSNLHPKGKHPSIKDDHDVPTLSDHGTVGRVDATIPEDRSWPQLSMASSPTLIMSPPSTPRTAPHPHSLDSSTPSHTSHWRPSYAATHSALGDHIPLSVHPGQPVLYDPYYSLQLEQRRPSKARFWSLHFCGWHQVHGNCCVKPTFQGPLQSKNIEHLPVCHAKCWKRERNRLREASWHRPEGGGGDALPLCHRVCYLTKLWQMRSEGRTCTCDHCLVQCVPHNRSVWEKLGWPTLVHFVCHECASHGVM